MVEWITLLTDHAPETFKLFLDLTMSSTLIKSLAERVPHASVSSEWRAAPTATSAPDWWG